MAKQTVHGRAGLRHDQDGGNALVVSIAAVLMVGLLMGVIFSSVMFSVGSVSKNRAQAAARSAAEGGAQQVARKLLQQKDGPQTCSNLEPAPDAWVNYDVEGVWFKENEGDRDWTRCDNGGPAIPKLAHAVMVKTTGYSLSAGTEGGDRGGVGLQGNKRGDEATVEMVFQRPASLGLDHAVFGDQTVLSNTNFNLYPDPEHPSRPSTQGTADVVTNKDWSCPASGTITGNVYAMGNISVPSDCIIEGNLYVKGNPHIGAKLEVHGKMYVEGNLGGSKIVAHDDVLISGNLALSSAGHDFRKDVRVMGTFSSSDSIASSFKQKLHTKGAKGDGWGTKETANGLGSRFVSNAPASGPEWVFPSLFDTAKNPATQEDKERVAFPMLTPEMAPFNTFTARTWQDLTGRACPDTSNGPNAISITSPTAIDLRGCGNIALGKLDIKLSADLVLFTKNITNNGSWSVTTGNAAGDEKRRTLYLVALPDSGQTQCQSGKGSSIHFATSGWSQRDVDGQIRTKVVLYSAGVTSMASKPSGVFSGQLYGCEVLVQSGIDIRFARGGDDFTDTLWDLGIGAVRDITDEPRP